MPFRARLGLFSSNVLDPSWVSHDIVAWEDHRWRGINNPWKIKELEYQALQMKFEDCGLFTFWPYLCCRSLASQLGRDLRVCLYRASIQWWEILMVHGRRYFKLFDRNLFISLFLMCSTASLLFFSVWFCLYFCFDKSFLHDYGSPGKQLQNERTFAALIYLMLHSIHNVHIKNVEECRIVNVKPFNSSRTPNAFLVYHLFWISAP